MSSDSTISLWSLTAEAFAKALVAHPELADDEAEAGRYHDHEMQRAALQRDHNLAAARKFLSMVDSGRVSLADSGFSDYDLEGLVAVVAAGYRAYCV